MKVKVSEQAHNGVGFYNYVRRRIGDVFTIPDEPRRALFPGEQNLVNKNDEMKAVYERIKDKDGKVPQDFSFRWMVPVAEVTPERVTTAQQSVNQKNEEILGAKRSDAAADKDGAGIKSDVI